MSSRNLCASMLMACLLGGGLGGFAPAANAASAGPSMVKPAESGADHLIEVGGRSRAPEAHLSVGPSYRYYDYPYYYSRGYYPTHIGPHYVYDYPDGSTSASYYDEDDEGGAPYSAQERCARRFKSFDWDTGRYTTYGGRSKLCPYLR